MLVKLISWQVGCLVSWFAIPPLPLKQHNWQNSKTTRNDTRKHSALLAFLLFLPQMHGSKTPFITLKSVTRLIPFHCSLVARFLNQHRLLQRLTSGVSRSYTILLLCLSSPYPPWYPGRSAPLSWCDCHGKPSALTSPWTLMEKVLMPSPTKNATRK